MTGGHICTSCIERINELEDELQVLRESVGLNFWAPIEWRLTGSETQILGVLIARGQINRSGIMGVLYSARGGNEPSAKIIDVFMCTLRRKLKPTGLEIRTRWGVGYEMTREMRDRAILLTTRVAA